MFKSARAKLASDWKKECINPEAKFKEMDN